MSCAVLGHFSLLNGQKFVSKGCYLRFLFSLQISNLRKNSKRVHEPNTNNDFSLKNKKVTGFILHDTGALTLACGVCSCFPEGIEDVDKSEVVSCRV